MYLKYEENRIYIGPPCGQGRSCFDCIMSKDDVADPREPMYDSKTDYFHDCIYHDINCVQIRNFRRPTSFYRW